ncbi:MAG: endonuclease/exonuclease/phosphatase family protein [Proteobacteria bacterium]|nr:endonuclease/exonuclease/phosphatase family protein [Pseudomonadota bacterium]
MLHRVHAENYIEPSIVAHPDERARTLAIADRLESLGDLVALQEVSGDQLAVIRARYGARALVWSAQYPRVPHFRGGSTTSLVDPTEHLVTIVFGRPVRGSTAHTFASDPGKGYVTVELDGLLVINTHVSYGDRSAAQLGQVAAVAAAHAGPTVIVGDFNAHREAVLAGLGGVAILPPDGSLPTRPRGKGASKSPDIDHVIVHGAVGSDARVLDSTGLSDHHIVTATIEI